MTKIALLCCAVTALVGGVAVSPAAAANPPRVGSVSCGSTGLVAFARSFQFVPDHKPNGQPKPDLDTRVGFKNAAAGCSGSQTGGNPRRPGPIDHGRFAAKGYSTGHTCSGLTAHGLRDVKGDVTWYDAAGANLGVTKITGGSATVSGLGNGAPSSWPPPNNPSPGIVTFTITGTASAASSAFPGSTVHATFVADQTTDSFPLPCSTRYPPQSLRLDGFVFSGVNGPSTISVS